MSKENQQIEKEYRARVNKAFDYMVIRIDNGCDIETREFIILR
jgi:hypothetical protein